MQFLKSVIVSDVTPAADGSYTYDLGVNPISHLSLALKCLNATDEATVAQILALITNIEVLHRGTSIFQASAADTYALDHILLRNAPIILNQVATDNATRAVLLTIPFGRTLWDPDECFPASRAGELKLRLTVDIATSDADGLILLVEQTELLGAAPARFLKTTTLSKTPSATGWMDVDIPIAYVYAGFILWSTTIPTTTAWTTTIDQVKLLLDNTEADYSLSNWEALRCDLTTRIGQRPGRIAAYGDDHIANYALLDLCPNGDDRFLLDSKGLSSLKIRVNAGDTNALRVIPLELVPAAIGA